MSKATSPSAGKPYGLARVCRSWRVPRSSVYAVRRRGAAPPREPARRGPRRTVVPDAEALAAIQGVLSEPRWLGEGYRKVWARLRLAGMRIAPRRVLRIMREHGLLALHPTGRRRGPRAHDGTIRTERPDEMWGIDATHAATDEGGAAVFVLVDHCTGECMGLHAARRGTRFEALEAVRQAVRASRGAFDRDVARGTALRHDHGSQFTSHAFQEEIAFLGIRSSPSYVAQPEGNGCAERFIRTLKEQLLWVRRFPTVEALQDALAAFRRRYNESWLVQAHGWKTPAQVRAERAA